MKPNKNGTTEFPRKEHYSAPLPHHPTQKIQRPTRRPCTVNRIRESIPPKTTTPMSQRTSTAILTTWKTCQTLLKITHQLVRNQVSQRLQKAPAHDLSALAAGLAQDPKIVVALDLAAREEHFLTTVEVPQRNQSRREGRRLQSTTRTALLTSPHLRFSKS